MLPWESFDELDLLARDRFGSNNGNLIYQYSVVRTLMLEDVEFYSDDYIINPDRADEINEKYDAYILPFADAFRENFIGDLNKYTELIKKLNIPVIVIGIGVRAPFGYDIKNGFSYDDDVRAFVQAVLEKSSIIGLRGQITANYLEYLGFVPEKDFTVIGCPSMYTFGREIKLREVSLNQNSQVYLNAGDITTQETMLFLDRVSNRFKNYYFIPQVYQEFVLNYLGIGTVENVVPNFPQNIASKYYAEGRVKYFLNASTWFDYMKQTSLSIGTRLHGNIVATINGTPSITIVHDTRMKELADYHQLPSITLEEVNETSEIEELINRVDFNKVSEVHPKRFDHYIEFLEKNNLNHIYQEKFREKDIPLDKLVKNKVFHEPMSTINTISEEKRNKRLIEGHEIYLRRIKRLDSNKNRETIKKLELQNDTVTKEFETLKSANNKIIKENEILKLENDKMSKELNSLKLENDKKIKEYETLKLRFERTLNRKSVRIPLFVADKISRLKK